MRSVSPLPLSTSPSQPSTSSTVIANDLLVQTSPSTSHSVIKRPLATSVKPVSHFQKLLHIFNGNKSLNNSFIREAPFTSSQQRPIIKANDSMTTIIRNTNNNQSLEQSISQKQQSNESFPPPPPPEMAHEQLLDILLQNNRAQVSSISPSLSTSSSTTHTSMQRMIMNKKTQQQQQQQQIPINPTGISPSMSNSDLSFSSAGINALPPSTSFCKQINLFFKISS